MDNNQKIAIEFLRSAEAESMKVAQASVQPISKKDELATFFIRISPTVNMTIDGNHPLVFIIQDLEAFGTAKASYYRISCEELDRRDHVNKMVVNEETLSAFSLRKKFNGDSNKNVSVMAKVLNLNLLEGSHRVTLRNSESTKKTLTWLPR